MRRDPGPGGGHRVGGLLGIAGGLLVMALCARYVLRALATGTMPGRRGAVHHMPEPAYLVSVAACVLGICMGGYLIRLGWRWLRGLP